MKSFAPGISPSVLPGYEPIKKVGSVTYYMELEQGTDEWHDLRRGILTASELHKILTPTLRIASNDKERAHLFELVAQRVSGFTEPAFISFDMMRGKEDEVLARMAYSEHFAEIHDCGFVTNDSFGFTLGYSPDGLIGDDGLWECKSRAPKYQVQTILDHVAPGGTTIPADYVIQCQAGLLISMREWLDFTSYCGGLPMITIRVWPDDLVQSAILEAAEAFNAKMDDKISQYNAALQSGARLIETEPVDRTGDLI